MSASKPASKDASHRAGEAEREEVPAASLERRIIEYAQLGVPLAVLGGTVIAGSMFGPPAAVLVLASGALVSVIAVFWASLRTMLGETPLSGADAYAIGAPSTEEEQKQAVLRALKDLEFERSVGKISEEDYRELVAKYRAEAKRLLRILDVDAGPRRAHVESLVAKRLRRAGFQGTEAEDADGRDEGAPGDAAACACASCGTMNDEDAIFCKKCGARQPQAAETREDEDDDASDQDEDGVSDRPRAGRGAS
jgi:hypothetical protein